MDAATRETFPSLCHSLLRKIEFAYTPLTKEQFALFVDLFLKVSSVFIGDSARHWACESLSLLRDNPSPPLSLFTESQKALLSDFQLSIQKQTEAFEANKRPYTKEQSKDPIIDRYVALYEMQRQVEQTLGSAIYSKEQYALLIDFVLALRHEMAATINLSKELTKIHGVSHQETWQDETLTRIIRAIDSDINSMMDRSDGQMDVRLAARKFWEALKEENLRIRKKLHGNCSRCGIVNSRNEVITISFFDKDYNKRKPDEIICRACDWKEKIDKFEESGELNSTLVTEAVLSRIRCGNRTGRNFPKQNRNEKALAKINSQLDDITAAAERFEAKIWIPWLQKFMADSKDRRFSAQTEHIKVLAFCGLGRVLITIQDQFPMNDKRGKYNGGSISLKVSEESRTPQSMGWQGIAATKEEAVRLLDDACIVTTPETLKFDKDVSFMGM